MAKIPELDKSYFQTCGAMRYRAAERGEIHRLLS